jgi:hypothetical protein
MEVKNEGRCLDYPIYFCHPDNFIECENCENNFRLTKRKRHFLFFWKFLRTSLKAKNQPCN